MSLVEAPSAPVADAASVAHLLTHPAHSAHPAHPAPPAPPLPPMPPPLPRPAPAARTTPNPHCQVAAMQAAAALAAEPLPTSYMPGYQPQTPPMMPFGDTSWDSQTWQWDPTVPPISAMLMREADAWRALLQLHGSVLNLTRTMSGATTNEVENPQLRLDEPREASEQREASYIASITQLCAQCDQLVSEAVKIRGLRKAKHQAETQALKEILRTHADEALGMGDVLARNSAMQIASVTSELRQAAQAMRAQVQQARALLAAAAEWRTVVPKGAPAECEFVMGWRSGESLEVRPVAQVLEHVYQRGQLTDDTLVAALLEGAVAEPGHAVSQQRTFSRRSADRQLRQELVAVAEKTES